MLWTIFAILLVLWLLGWGFHVAGGLIHVLLVIAGFVVVVNLLFQRRASASESHASDEKQQRR